MSPGVVQPPSMSDGTGTVNPVGGSSGAPNLNVTGNLDTLLSEFEVQQQLMEFMNDKVNEFLGLASIRTQVIEVATEILNLFLQPLSMLNPGELDPSGVFEGLSKVMELMGGAGDIIGDVSNQVGDVVNAAEQLSGQTSEHMNTIAESEPDNAKAPWHEDAEFGFGYSGGFESSNESIEKVSKTSVKMGVDANSFVGSVKDYVKTINTTVKDFKNMAAQVKETSKELTENTDSVKDFVSNLDMLNRAVLAIVAVMAVPPPTWGAATLFLSFDTGVLEWVKSIMAELQEIQEMVNSMSNTMESMQGMMDHPVSRLGVPY